MEKIKIQRDTKSGGGIITEMQQVGKDDFLPKDLKNDPNIQKVSPYPK
jgi:hypothetical protein